MWLIENQLRVCYEFNFILWFLAEYFNFGKVINRSFDEKNTLYLFIKTVVTRLRKLSYCFYVRYSPVVFVFDQKISYSNTIIQLLSYTAATPLRTESHISVFFSSDYLNTTIRYLYQRNKLIIIFYECFSINKYLYVIFSTTI